MSIRDKFRIILNKILYAEDGSGSLVGLNLDNQINFNEKDDSAYIRNCNAAFLSSLTGEYHPQSIESYDYLKEVCKIEKYFTIAQFYEKGREYILNEIETVYEKDSLFRENFDELYQYISLDSQVQEKHLLISKMRKLFFPEGVFSLDSKEEEIEKLRKKREVTITSLNQDPVSDVAKDLIFTSNVLLTIPSEVSNINNLPYNDTIKKSLGEVKNEEQLYWYDHPIQIGTPPDSNECIYGLNKLSEAIEFEQKNKTGSNSKAVCILSVSVTHKGLRPLAKEYLEAEMSGNCKADNLEIYIFTEKDTDRIIEEILIPAAQEYLPESDLSLFQEIFGVDGEYGKHYTFLKAITALWKVFLQPDLKGTFKIDLDQVFPQEELLEETGSTAFGHLKTPLWGADAMDSNGDAIHLGLIAGALVNESDIRKSVFTPDVPFPDSEGEGEDIIFYSKKPQALSTVAEMMTRYNDDSEIDGIHKAIQRIHVTGGTNGILIDSLLKYRPFTPSFIGRAEDQAYLLSVLFEGDSFLRYVHKDGLIMRHDKQAFIGEAIKAAKIGKLIGDYIRILLFSRYVNSLPWENTKTKEYIDPFTGAFGSKIPLTVVFLRFALKGAGFFEKDQTGDGVEFISMGSKRLLDLIDSLESDNDFIAKRYSLERKGWNLFYDLLIKAQQGINNKNSFAEILRKKAVKIAEDCKLTWQKDS